MSRPVLPEPAGASTIHERATSRARSRSAASGGSPARIVLSDSISLPSTKRLFIDDLPVLILVLIGLERDRIQSAYQSLRAVLARLWVLFRLHPHIACGKLLCQLCQHAAPVFDLRGKRSNLLQPGRLGEQF